MCDPVSIAAGGLAVTVLAAGATAYGQYQQQQAQNSANNYNAQVAQYQEQQSIQLGKVQAEQNDIQTSQLEARQKAAYAGAGVDPDSGTPLIINQQTAGYGALDSLAIKQKAAAQAWGFMNSSNLDQMKDVNPLGAAGTSLLNSGSQIGGKVGALYNASVNSGGTTNSGYGTF